MNKIVVKTKAALHKVLKTADASTLMVLDLSKPLAELVGPLSCPVELINKTVIDKIKNLTVQSMGGSSTVQRMGDSSTVQRMWGSSTVQSMGDSSTVQSMGGSSTVQSMGDSSTVQSMWGNAIVRVFSSRATAKILHAALAITVDCNPVIEGPPDQIIKMTTFIHDIKSFVNLYENDEGELILYKSVKENSLTDFYTGRIKYEGSVECPDFDPDPNRQCGGGLHLSPTPEAALSYSPNGKVLRCLVDPKDIVVYGKDITKVRCRKVTVLEGE